MIFSSEIDSPLATAGAGLGGVFDSGVAAGLGSGFSFWTPAGVTVRADAASAEGLPGAGAGLTGAGAEEAAEPDLTAVGADFDSAVTGDLNSALDSDLAWGEVAELVAGIEAVSAALLTGAAVGADGVGGDGLMVGAAGLAGGGATEEDAAAGWDGVATAFGAEAVDAGVEAGLG